MFTKNPVPSFAAQYFNTKHCRGNLKQRDHLYDLMRREVPIRDPETPNMKLCPPPVTYGHDVKENGATVIPESSITVFEEAAAPQTIIDPPSTNEQLVFKKLRQSDALDNNLLQCSAKKKVASSKSKSSSSAAGMFYYFLNSSVCWCCDFGLSSFISHC